MGRPGERVAIVTGGGGGAKGGGGIGSAVARALAAEGASVVIAGVRDAGHPDSGRMSRREALWPGRPATGPPRRRRAAWLSGRSDPVTRPAGTGGTTPSPDRPYGTCAGPCRSAGTSGPGRPGGR